MTVVPRGWLPMAALADSAIETALLLEANQWLAEWCTDAPSLAIALTQQEATRRAPLADAPLADTQGAAVTLDDGSACALGLTIAGLDKSAALTRADRNLLESLGRAAAANLETRLSGAHGSANARGEPDILTMTLSSGEPALRMIVQLDREAAIKLRRSHAAPAMDAGPPESGAISSALAPQSVDIAVLIGSCSLPLNATRDLSVGDTLLLGTPIDAPVALVVDARLVVPAAGRLSVQGSSIALTICAPKAEQ